jgi:hypothetical protein
MKTEKLAGWYPADPAFRRKFERAVVDGFRLCAQHGDLSLVQRHLNTIPDQKVRHSFATHLKGQFPVSVSKDGALGLNRERAKDFDWSILETAKIWPRRLHLSNAAFSVGAEKFAISELIDDFIDAILLSRHTVPEGELKRLRDTVDTVLARRSKAPSDAAASSSVRVVK